MLNQAVEAFTNLDARLWRTLRDLVLQPGELTVLYHRGLRNPYIGPFALFVLTNVVFFAVVLLPGSSIFSTPLEQHLHHQPWSSFAQDLVRQNLADRGTSLEAYAPVFDQAVTKNAKSFVFLMAVPMALLLPVLFGQRRLPFAVHLAFSLHFHAFLMLLVSAGLLIPAMGLLLGGIRLASPALDHGITIGALLVSAMYLYMSAGRVYGDHGSVRIFKALLLTLAVGAVVLGYRFTLLLVTLHTT